MVQNFSNVRLAKPDPNTKPYVIHDIEVWGVSKPNLWRIVRRNIREEILIQDGNLFLDQVTKEDNRRNKQYL